MSVGSCFGAALDSEGQLWTWGANVNGELGLGDAEGRPEPTLIDALNGKKAEHVRCGGSFAFALGPVKHSLRQDSVKGM